MKWRKYTIFFVLFIGFLSLLMSQEKISPNYRVGPQDMIEITIFGHPELSRSVRISEEGKIPFPYIGEIEVNGFTRLEIEKKMKTAIDEILLQDAQVTVFIKEFHSQKVSLLGAVVKQDQYELNGRETLLSLISKAGGITESAGEDIIVIRQLPDNTTQSLKISIHDLIMMGDPALDIPLQANDIINVPKDEIVKIYFVGEVTTTGALEVKRSKIPTLLQAIIQQGGFTPKAALKNIMIRRIGQDGEEQMLTVNVRAILKGRKKDVPLKENDTIYVQETIF
ncbi:MAG: polysaccharide biosynthesis/export family protein [Candidatus Aminicenantes bacterium]|nr:polysaccharide biosynthesis/export family protein [Candidatus Aminicenantes bacterium]